MSILNIDNWDEYLREIGRIELLTREEEIELAQNILNGDDKSLTRLAQANLRFVVALAAQYVTKDVEGEQRIQELKKLTAVGNKALEQAAWEYYTATDKPFAKFAVPFIREAMEKQE
jgi:RNA polymerase primary sigma factor